MKKKNINTIKEQSENKFVSFVIKMWVEETDPLTGNEKWRGRITVVGSYDQCYFDNLIKMLDFIKEYSK